MKARFRPNIEAMTGYVPGEQPQGTKLIKLNTNENPYPPSPKVIEAVRAAASESLKLYPDPMSTALREKAAGVYGFDSAEWVLAGNGSDDLLTMVVRAFVPEGGKIATTRPTYTLYRTLAEIQGAACAEIPFGEGYSLPREKLAACEADLVFVANPNSPSGTFVEPGDLAALAAEVDSVLVIDEAYVDFSRANCAALVREAENVVVLRTFSKSYSLAGLRVGLALAAPVVIEGLVKVKDSYNLDRVAQAAALAALDDTEWMELNAGTIKATRGRLIEALRRVGCDVPGSESNFVFATIASPPAHLGAEAIKVELQARGILVRWFDEDGLRDSLRITVGTDEEIDEFLGQIGSILEREI